MVQTCVVTFEPVPAQVEAEFDRLFSQDVPAEADGEVEIDPEAELPEPLIDDGSISARSWPKSCRWRWTPTRARPDGRSLLLAEIGADQRGRGARAVRRA